MKEDEVVDPRFPWRRGFFRYGPGRESSEEGNTGSSRLGGPVTGKREIGESTL